MKKLLIISLIFLGIKVNAQNYIHQDTVAITLDDQTLHFNFPLPSPIGISSNATLSVYYRGDYSAPSEHFDIYLENVLLADSVGADYSYSSDCGGYDTAIFMLSQTRLAALVVGGIDLTCDNTSGVGVPAACGNPINSRIIIKLEMDTCSFGSVISFSGLEESYCKTEPSVTLTPSDAGGVFSGSGVSGNSFSPGAVETGTNYIGYVLSTNGCASGATEGVYSLPTPSNLTIDTCSDLSIQIPAIASSWNAWYDGPIGGNLLDTGSTFNINTQKDATYHAAIGAREFYTDSIIDTNFQVVNDSSIIGDDRGGIAITPDYLYIVGDNNTVRMNANDLSNLQAFPIRDGIFSDLNNGDLYTLYGPSGEPNAVLNNYVLTSLRSMDDELVIDANDIILSDTIILDDNIYDAGVFAGYGFVVIYSGSTDGNWYSIDLETGNVTTILSNFFPRTKTNGDNWATWGYVEGKDCEWNVVYPNSSDLFFRVQLTTERVDTIAGTTTGQNFNLGDMYNITYSPWNNRMYFSYENTSQFGNFPQMSGWVELSTVDNGIQVCECRAEVSVNVSGDITLGDDQTFCEGAAISLTLDAGASGSYEWSNGSVDQTITVTSAGTYGVTVDDGTGCLAHDEIVISLQNCTNIDENEESTVKIYPNPTTGIINLEMHNTGDESFTIELIDVNGKVIVNKSFNSTQSTTTLDATGYAKGLYLLKISNANESITEKLVIK